MQGFPADGRDRTARLVYGLGVAAVVVCFALRYRAAWYSYPFRGHADEIFVVGPAFRIATTGDLDPHFFNYPSFTFYVLAGVFRAIHWIRPSFAGAAASPDHFVVARLVVLLFSSVTLILAAELGRRLLGRTAGVLAAAFLAVAPLHSKYSFIVSVNPAVALWATASCLAAVLLLERRTRFRYVLAGACVGLAVGSKYIGVTAALPVVLAHFAGRREAGRARIAELFVFLGTLVVAFAITTPYAVITPRFFLSQLGEVQELQGSSNYPLHYSAAGSTYGDYAAALVHNGYLAGPLVLALLGLIGLSVRDWRKAALLAAHPVGLYAVVGAYRIFWLRNLLAAIPCLAVFSAAGVMTLAAVARGAFAGGRRTVLVPWLVGGALALLALFPSAARTGEEVRAASLKDTRAAALTWVLEHVPPGARIVREQRTPEIEEFSEDYIVREVRTIVRPDRRAEFTKDYDYALISYAFLRHLRRAPEFADERERYAEFFRSHRMVAEFPGDEIKLTGVTIRIYDLSE